MSFHWERGWLLIHPMVMLISEALEYIPELMFLMCYLLYRLPVCRFSEQSSHRSPGLFDLCVLIFLNLYSLLICLFNLLIFYTFSSFYGHSLAGTEFYLVGQHNFSLSFFSRFWFLLKISCFLLILAFLALHYDVATDLSYLTSKYRFC